MADMAELLAVFRERSGLPVDTPPAFRLDVLASNLCERLVAVSGNPMVHALYYNVRPLLDQELTKALGPVGTGRGKGKGRKNRTGGMRSSRSPQRGGGPNNPRPSGCSGPEPGSDAPRYPGDGPVIDAEFWEVKG